MKCDFFPLTDINRIRGGDLHQSDWVQILCVFIMSSIEISCNVGTNTIFVWLNYLKYFEHMQYYILELIAYKIMI